MTLIPAQHTREWLYRLASHANATHGLPGQGICPVCGLRAAVEALAGRCEDCARRTRPVRDPLPGVDPKSVLKPVRLSPLTRVVASLNEGENS